MEFLPGVPAEAVLSCLRRSPGNELGSGKSGSPESSAALAVNGLGWFIGRAGLLPQLPGVPMGRPEEVRIEVEMRFPWRGGRHPWLDAAVMTQTTLVGIESKRFEPFRPGKVADFSPAFDRNWGGGLSRHVALMRDLAQGRALFRTLDAAQLVKHAFGLATQAQKQGRGAVLVYLYAEPLHWASGKAVDPGLIALHRTEIDTYAARVSGDLVTFVPLRWRDLLAQWAGDAALSGHAAAVSARFGPL